MKSKNTKSTVAFLLLCLINLCVGSLYAWSVFAGPMGEYLDGIVEGGLPAGAMSLVFTVATAVGPITMILGGKINDRFGARWILFAAGIMFGGGMILSGLSKNLGLLIFGYGVLGGLGGAVAYSTSVSTAIKYFPEKRGLIGGITTACYGISSVIVSKLAGAMIETKGVTNTFIYLGIAFLVIICAGSLFVVKPKEQPAAMQNAADSGKDKNWKQMLSSVRFYLMFAILLCGAICGMMCISRASTIAQNIMQISAAGAATVVAVLALFNTAGRVICGYISDKVGRTTILMASSFVAVIGLLLLFISEQSGSFLFYIGIVCVGLYFGTFMGVFPGFVTDAFGLKYNSVNYGIMFIGFALAGFVGPSIISSIYTTRGSYGAAFLIGIGFTAVGIVLILLYKRFYEKKG